MDDIETDVLFSEAASIIRILTFLVTSFRSTILEHPTKLGILKVRAVADTGFDLLIKIYDLVGDYFR